MKKELEESKKLGFSRYEVAKKNAGFPDKTSQVPDIFLNPKRTGKQRKEMKKVMTAISNNEPLTKEMVSGIYDNLPEEKFNRFFQNGIPLSYDEADEAEEKRKNK